MILYRLPFQSCLPFTFFLTHLIFMAFSYSGFYALTNQSNAFKSKVNYPDQTHSHVDASLQNENLCTDLQSGQTVKNVHRLTFLFELNQSQCKPGASHADKSMQVHVSTWRNETPFERKLKIWVNLRGLKTSFKFSSHLYLRRKEVGKYVGKILAPQRTNVYSFFLFLEFICSSLHQPLPLLCISHSVCYCDISCYIPNYTRLD